MKHGTVHAYNYYGCHCSLCRDAVAAHQRDWSARTSSPIPHGTVYGYTTRACRCDDCRAAHAAQIRAWRERSKAAQ